MKLPKAENLELAAALMVTAGLVAGNMYFFFPFREDTRFKNQGAIKSLPENTRK